MEKNNCPSNVNKSKIAVIGAGGWGTAIASLASQNGHEVKLWAYEKEVAQEINSYHRNTDYLPDVKLDEKLHAVSEPGELIGSEYYIIGVPTQHIRNLFSEKIFKLSDRPVLSLAKGIERGSLMRVSQIFEDLKVAGSETFGVITGPSHAEEVVRQLPTTVVAASENSEVAGCVQTILNNEYFRVYTSEDVVGSEFGGSLKNVIAIAAGMIDGLGMGDNTKAALLTRGLAEISRLGTASGANPLTFSGLSGLGDLFVTCSSLHSRNRRVGELIGKGSKMSEILRNTKMVAEGVWTAESAYQLGKKHGVEMPITEQVYKILFQEYEPLDAIRNLMSRKTRREWWW